MISTDTWLKIICSMMINAVVFGAGAITVLSVPALADYAKFLIPAVVVVSFAVAPFLSGLIAPRMRSAIGAGAAGSGAISSPDDRRASQGACWQCQPERKAGDPDLPLCRSRRAELGGSAGPPLVS